MKATAKPSKTLQERIKAADWKSIAHQLDDEGSAPIERLLSPEECETVIRLYKNDHNFRSRVVMAQHNFGRGE